jgi:hypothetical protein
MAKPSHSLLAAALVAGPASKLEVDENEGHSFTVVGVGSFPFIRRCAGSWGASRAIGCPGGIYVPVFLGKVAESVAEEGWRGTLSNAEAAKASGRCVTNSRSA